MKLHQHPDFDQVILAAAQHHRARGWRPAFLEKDYYVTEVLRTVADAAPGRVIFKGGTSLSKGWSLIERFSEDIDLFLDPAAFEPQLGKNAIDRELKKLRDAVRSITALEYRSDESSTIGGVGRSDVFRYEARFSGPGEVVPRVLLEAGVASGREPTELVGIRSFLAEFLQATGVALGTENEGSFPMRLLHFRRTFVEKLFAIHKKVELYRRDGTPIGGHARHYYDLYQLAGRAEVLEMLESAEYRAIMKDYERVSRRYFPAHYFAPEDMLFANSAAIFPTTELSAKLSVEYRRQCAALCYGPFPTWEEVLERFAGMRRLL